MQDAQKKSSKHPLITVVIPAFNEEKYLPRCLESIKQQTYPKDRFEVTVADNNSSDQTAKIAKKFGAKVIEEKEQGYVFALGTGMHAASGDIIAVTDADTQVSRNWLTTIARIFEDKDIVGVTGSSGIDTDSKIANLLGRVFYTIFLACAFALGKPNLAGSNMAVARIAFVLVNGIDMRFKMSPDVDLGCRLKSIGKVKFEKDLFVVTSARRFRKGFLKALLEYAKGYIFAAWFRKPPNVIQKVIR